MSNTELTELYLLLLANGYRASWSVLELLQQQGIDIDLEHFFCYDRDGGEDDTYDFV